MTKKLADPKTSYGLTSELFADRKPDGDTIELGGVGGESKRWSRPLTRRAANLLWFHLTRVLFPEKSPRVTGMAQTAPIGHNAEPLVTTHLELVRNAETHTFDIMGWIGEETWWFRVDEQNARHLWKALDEALYPAGWQGPRTQHNKLN